VPFFVPLIEVLLYLASPTANLWPPETRILPFLLFSTMMPLQLMGLCVQDHSRYNPGKFLIHGSVLQSAQLQLKPLISTPPRQALEPGHFYAPAL
jgi:hypothetical protein